MNQLKLSQEMEPLFYFLESHCNPQVNQTMGLKMKSKFQVLSKKFHLKPRFQKLNWKRKILQSIPIPTFTKLRRKIFWVKWESNPELLTFPWRLISTNLWLKARSQKVVMELFTKAFGERQLWQSKCSKLSLKMESKISSVNAQLWKHFDIQILLCFLGPAQNLQTSRLFWSIAEKALFGQRSKI